MSKSFSVADVASHKDADSGMYIIIDDGVYDVTGASPFLLSLPYHPSPFHSPDFERSEAQMSPAQRKPNSRDKEREKGIKADRKQVS